MNDDLGDDGDDPCLRCAVRDGGACVDERYSPVGGRRHGVTPGVR